MTIIKIRYRSLTLKLPVYTLCSHHKCFIKGLAKLYGLPVLIKLFSVTLYPIGNLNLAVLRGLRLSAFCCGSNISAKVQILWCTLD